MDHERPAAPRPADGYRHWQAVARAIGTDPDPMVRRRVRVALLATFTGDFLTELLPVAALAHRLEIRTPAVPFGQVEQALLDARSPLRDDPPDYVVLAGTATDLVPADFRPGDAATAKRLSDEAVARWTRLWDAAAETGAQAVQLGFAPPAVDPSGAAAWRSPGSVSALVREVNQRLSEQAAGRVRFVDVERIAAEYGLARWSDARYWYRLRQPCALDATPWLAAAVVDAIAVDLGLTRRCVVVDLDDTLWGGVVGQDGLDGLQLGSGPVGEAYADFQRYLAGLASRGVVLAVCSKNDPELAERALAEVPGMILRREDFAAVSAGWEPKSRQLAGLTRTLRLAPDALVFVDDNPAERAEVAAALPDVAVVDLPTAPSEYAAALAAVPGLAAGTGTADAGRSRSYAALARAEALAAQHHDLGDYLRRLEMTATLGPVDAAALPRAAELVGKTNQFNLTTRRRTQAELAAVIARTDTFAARLRLADRFADHGDVGLVVAVATGVEVEIDTLLLSCRVIGRTAERALVAAVGRWAVARGACRLVGRYVPTDRNALVRDAYLDLGFRLRDENPDGTRVFVHDLANGAPAASPYLKETVDAG
jgi:FkbH-like protein